MRALSGIGCAGALAAAAHLVCIGTAAAQTPLTTQRVAFGLSGPLLVTHAPGDFTRAFIVEKRAAGVGRIRILTLPANTLVATPFLSIPGLATDTEQGLLGLAFHPNYPTNGYFYVNYTLPGGSFGMGVTVIERYQASPPGSSVVDPATAQVVLRIDQPQTNHNGGWMSFGPDGYLYIAMGDGGNGGDTGPGHTSGTGNAQDITDNLLGKMLRLDVNGDDFPADPARNYRIPPTNPYAGAITGDDEIWALGLRNPWRNDFDPQTGDLFVADVGQDLWEEINFLPYPQTPGRNFGWRCYEGNAVYNATNCPGSPPSNWVFPFLTYGHTTSVPPTNAVGCSLTGGVVYRGCAIPDLDGTYFFADYCNSQIFSLRYNGATISNFTNRTAELEPTGTPAINNVQSFGRDAFGEVYICDANGGEVFKIVPATIVGPDCNSNGRRDACDIRAGSSRDINRDGFPDECVCPADWDGNGQLQPADVALFVTDWANSLSQGTLIADYDGNGLVLPSDVAAFVNSWFNALNGGC